ncbi:hypothetical protein Tco_0528568 [Tanacetum coccineum]
MDYQCTQPSEEIDKIIQRTQERGIEIFSAKRRAKSKEEKRIAKEKEATELEAKRKSQECLNIEEKSIPQASIRSRKSRIDPTLSNFTVSTKRIPLSDFIPPVTPNVETVNSLSMGDKHLDTSKDSLESSVRDPVPIPSESADLSDGESECDVPINDDSPESHFSTFDNPLFDSNDDFSSDDESLSEEEIQKDEFKYFSNPLYDLDDEIITNEKILPNQKDLDVVIPIPPGIDERCFNAESDLLESLLNRDSPIDSTKIDSIFDEFSLPRPPEESNSEISDATIESLSPSPILIEDSDSLMEEIDLFLASDDSMPTFDYLLEEFSGELAHTDPIPPGVVDTTSEPEEEIRLAENLSYDNSSPRPPEERNSEIADTIVDSLSPPPIPVEDSESLMEEINLFLAFDDSMPSGIEIDDYDSKGDICFLEELLSNDSPPLPENESFSLDHFDDPSLPRPPPETHRDV